MKLVRENQTVDSDEDLNSALSLIFSTFFRISSSQYGQTVLDRLLETLS